MGHSWFSIACFNSAIAVCLGGEIGRHAGLKILLPETAVRVQVPPEVRIRIKAKSESFWLCCFTGVLSLLKNSGKTAKHFPRQRGGFCYWTTSGTRPPKARQFPRNAFKLAWKCMEKHKNTNPRSAGFAFVIEWPAGLIRLKPAKCIPN